MTPDAGIERVPELVGPHDLSDAEVQALRGMLDGHVPLVDAERFNALVAGFGSGASLDPYWVVCELAGCSREMTALLRADIGLLRPCRLYEHTQGVLDGLERDYMALFPAPSLRRVLRLASLLGDIGKSLCVAVTGANREQAIYNTRVAENLLAVIAADTLTAAEREAVRLLLAWDLIGGAVQGRFDHGELEQMRVAWPRELALDDLVLTAYLADASAHTEHRSYRDAGTLELVPCIAPGDEALTWLFEAGPSGRLGLRVPEHRQIVRALFSALNVTADLAAPDQGPVQSGQDGAGRGFEEVAAADGAWSAELVLPSVPFAEVRDALERFAREWEFPISAFVRAPRGIAIAVTLIRDPSVRFGTPSVAACERAAEDLARVTGWKRAATSGRRQEGFTVGLGLRVGYDEYAPARPAYAALAGLLAHAREWHTTTAQLVSARFVDDEVQWYDERGIVITAGPALLPVVADLAHELGQQRFAVTDGAAGRTYALRRPTGA